MSLVLSTALSSHRAKRRRHSGASGDAVEREPPTDRLKEPGLLLSLLELLERQAEADAVFAEIDTDDDGFLTREEVIVYITKRGGTEEQASGTFDRLDTDKDGKVSKEEFRRALTGELAALGSRLIGL